MNRRAVHALAMLLLALVSGCAVGPDYTPPDPVAGSTLPARFAGDAGTTPAADPAVEGFWRAFGDPLLERLVADALLHNHDLRGAAANLRAARAVARLAGYDRYPTVTAEGSWQQARVAEHQLPGVDRDGRTGDTLDAGFDALWEADLFGRVRRGVEAARAEEDADLANLQDVQVSVSAEVARNYFILRGVQDQLAVARRNADNQSRSFELTRTRLDAGRGNELDTNRADAQLQTTLAGIPQLEAAIARTIYRLGVLTGRPPTALTTELADPKPLPALPALEAIGTPETLLRRRPDVRVAERKLAAATARIGVAVGDLFPRVTLIGAIGVNAGRTGDLDDSGAETYTIGPRITWAALDLGRVRRRIDVAEARTDAALAGYEQAVLGALEDAEGALVAFDRAQRRRETLTRAAAASGRAASIGRQRFEGGLTDFLDVLDAERTALQAEDLLAQSRTDAATALIAVYKALGGGWTSPEATSVVDAAVRPRD